MGSTGDRNGNRIAVAGGIRHAVFNGVKGANLMTFSVAKRRSLRGFGLNRHAGKHAAPKTELLAQHGQFEGAVKPRRSYQGLHKASGPRLSGPYEKRAA